MGRTVSVVQHVVRNVTSGERAAAARAAMRSHARNAHTWLLLAAAIAVALLAALQFRWLSELAVAQREVARRSRQALADRRATAVNDDFAALYAGVLEASRSGRESIASAVATWRGRAVFGELFGSVYGYQQSTARWIQLDSTDASSESIDTHAISAPAVANGAAWIAPVGGQSLPSIAVTLPSASDGIAAVLATLRADACGRLLRALSERSLADEMRVRLAIVELCRETRLLCADNGFDPHREDDGRASLFQLRPGALMDRSNAAAPSSTGVRTAPRGSEGAAIGVVMSRESQMASWELRVQRGMETDAAAVQRVQRRNLAVAFGLELVLVAAIVVTTRTARRAQRAADIHLKFSAAVAHELRTPLAAIKVLSQNLERGLVKPDGHLKQYGEMMAAEVDRLHGFVERALQFGLARASTR